MRKNLIFISLISAVLVSGCSYLLPEPHKIDIQQGNRVKPSDLEKIRLGMTPNQVKFVLGSPLLRDGFHQNRWDYIFYLKPGVGDVRQSRVSLYFKDGKLVRIDDSEYQPELQDINAPR